MSLSTLIVNAKLHVTCVSRKYVSGPLFVLREFDDKVLRKGGKRQENRTEQAMRSSVRLVVQKQNLKVHHANLSELKLLKGRNLVGKRAPSCSLLSAKDLIRLLKAYGKDNCVSDLQRVLALPPYASPPMALLNRKRRTASTSTSTSTPAPVALNRKRQRIQKSFIKQKEPKTTPRLCGYLESFSTSPECRLDPFSEDRSIPCKTSSLAFRLIVA